MPTKVDVIAQGLEMYDAMADEDNFEEVTADIINTLSTQIREHARGTWGKTREGGAYSKLPDHLDVMEDETYESYVATNDRGFELIDEMLSIESKLALVKPRLTDEQYNVLLTYVLDPDVESMAEACAKHGLDNKGYDRVRRQIRYACRGLEDIYATTG